MGLIAQVLYLAVNLFLWVPDASVPDDESEQSLLGETLEVLLCDSSRKAIGSSFPGPPLHVDIQVKTHIEVSLTETGLLQNCVTREPKRRNSGSCRCVSR
jgi:hypothetical protein